MLKAFALAPLQENPRGKFVVISDGQNLHVVLGPVNRYAYHANIVFAYTEEAGRAHASLDGSGLCHLLTPGWKVLGGGQYRLDDLTHTLKFSEKSTAYGKYPIEKLRALRDELPNAFGLMHWDLDLI